MAHERSKKKRNPTVSKRLSSIEAHLASLNTDVQWLKDIIRVILFALLGLALEILFLRG